jgi:uncharacterized protein
MEQAIARLLVDENLKGLTRWLRFLGFDTLLAEGWKDEAVAARAAAEKRILLTRDRELATRSPGALRITANSTREQLVEVLRSISIPAEDQWFRLCVKCNRPVREVSPAEGEKRVPHSSGRETPAPPFHKCEQCGRLYWQGSHYQRVQSYLRDAIKRCSPSGS